MIIPPHDRIALVDRSGTVTVSERDEAVARARGALVWRGVRSGDRVVVVVDNDRASIITCSAITSMGATAVLTHRTAGASELRYAVEATAPALVVAEPLDLHAEPVESVDVDSERPRVVVFTSGTTAMPKGVVHSASSLKAAAVSFQLMLGLTPADRLFLISPLASITGVLQALQLAPMVGAGVVLESRFEEDASLDLFLEGGATAYGGPDIVLAGLLDAADRMGIRLPLRVAALGGTALRRDLVDRIEKEHEARVVRIYGSSEVPCSTGGRPDEPADIRLADEGRPGPGVELDLDHDGELLVRGPHRCMGYLDGSPIDGGSGDGWFRTGDQAELLDGRLRIVGRLKDVASRSGRKVSLAEVDAAFASASGLRSIAAHVEPDRRTGERVAVAAHVPVDCELDVPAVLDAMLSSGLARWKLPESVSRLDHPLPVTATGKIRRHELQGLGVVVWRAARLAVDSPEP